MKVGLKNNSENVHNFPKFLVFMSSGSAPKMVPSRGFSLYSRKIESNVSESNSGISILSNDFFEKFYHRNQRSIDHIFTEVYEKKAVNPSVFRLLKFSRIEGLILDAEDVKNAIFRDNENFGIISENY